MPTDARAPARMIVPRDRLLALCAGHFPDEPIVPGAYIAGLFAEAGARALGADARAPAEIERCSFVAPLRPTEDAVVVTAEPEPANDGVMITAELHQHGGCVARGRLRFA